MDAFSSPPPAVAGAPGGFYMSCTLAIILLSVIGLFLLLSSVKLYFVCTAAFAEYRQAAQERAELRVSPLGGALKGLEEDQIRSLPCRAWEACGQEQACTTVECAVCLGEFESRQTVKELPACAHVFHSQCIDMWLRQSHTCPICRESLLSREEAAADTESGSWHRVGGWRNGPARRPEEGNSVEVAPHSPGHVSVEVRDAAHAARTAVSHASRAGHEDIQVVVALAHRVAAAGPEELRPSEEEPADRAGWSSTASAEGDDLLDGLCGSRSQSLSWSSDGLLIAAARRGAVEADFYEAGVISVSGEFMTVTTDSGLEHSLLEAATSPWLDEPWPPADAEAGEATAEDACASPRQEWFTIDLADGSQEFPEARGFFLTSADDSTMEVSTQLAAQESSPSKGLSFREVGQPPLNTGAVALVAGLMARWLPTIEAGLEQTAATPYSLEGRALHAMAVSV